VHVVRRTCTNLGQVSRSLTPGHVTRLRGAACGWSMTLTPVEVVDRLHTSVYQTQDTSARLRSETQQRLNLARSSHRSKRLTNKKRIILLHEEKNDEIRSSDRCHHLEQGH